MERRVIVAVCFKDTLVGITGSQTCLDESLSLNSQLFLILTPYKYVKNGMSLARKELGISAVGILHVLVV